VNLPVASLRQVLDDPLVWRWLDRAALGLGAVLWTTLVAIVVRG
jgi:hypothetical protein